MYSDFYNTKIRFSKLLNFVLFDNFCLFRQYNCLTELLKEQYNLTIVKLDFKLFNIDKTYCLAEFYAIELLGEIYIERRSFIELNIFE